MLKYDIQLNNQAHGANYKLKLQKIQVGNTKGGMLCGSG